VPTFEEFLGDTRAFIDLVVDQGPDGLEVVPGAVTYSYAGNWKMQIENSADAYHFFPTHLSYIQLLGRRKPAADAPVSVMQNYREQDIARGSFTFAHGHNLLWGANGNDGARPLAFSVDEVRARVGELRAKWMFYTRNLLVFPNFQLLENASLQIRINRPLGPDKTEITTLCIAPKGESPAARTRRIRQYEEFYNPSGLATPDDTTIFEDCQAGQQADAVDWHQGYMRGLAATRPGGNEQARELGIKPVASVSSTAGLGDETIFHGPFREWRRLLVNGLRRDESRPLAARGAAD
jgi:benzoate/toluate 1,2-dioxygenase subunit alpha